MADKQFNSRVGFLFAAVGSAVGLGNIWRFPKTAFDNGGGAFFLPYLIALITAGIPILILEYAIGTKEKATTALAYESAADGDVGKAVGSTIGWWQVAIAFIISIYYPIIIGWAIFYSFFAITKSWGSDPGSFFFSDFLHLNVSPGEFGGIVLPLFLVLLVVWAIATFTLLKGASGIEKANKIFIPGLLIMFSIVVIMSLFLNGAASGLDAFFKPDWSAMFDSSVWMAAYGQIFFSLSICFAIMVTYSSYLPDDSDIANNAMIAGFANSSIELMAGIGIFATLGFLATSQNVEVSEVVSGGVGLAFVVFPAILNEMGALGGVVGTLFFLSLVFAGLSSLISIIEAYVASVEEKFDLSRNKAIAIAVGISGTLSIIMATNGGLFFLDAIDRFVNHGIVFAGLAQLILIGWIAKKLGTYRDHVNEVSDVKIGKWWDFTLKYFTPIMLIIIGFLTIKGELETNYEGYSDSFLAVFGWPALIAPVIFGILFAVISRKKYPA